MVALRLFCVCLRVFADFSFAVVFLFYWFSLFWISRWLVCCVSVIWLWCWRFVVSFCGFVIFCWFVVLRCFICVYLISDLFVLTFLGLLINYCVCIIGLWVLLMLLSFLLDFVLVTWCGNSIEVFDIFGFMLLLFAGIWIWVLTCDYLLYEWISCVFCFEWSLN